jgi:hypothetical protein
MAISLGLLLATLNQELTEISDELFDSRQIYKTIIMSVSKCLDKSI